MRQLLAEEDKVAQKSKVLVIDDSVMARKLIVSYLNSEEYEIYEGKNGPEGLAVASEVHPDLILLDFVMPGMNGYEVYQALRSQTDFAETPVILFSSSYDEVVKKFGYPFEGFEFLHKHATNDQVVSCIESLLTGSQLGDDTVVGSTHGVEEVAIAPPLGATSQAVDTAQALDPETLFEDLPVAAAKATNQLTSSPAGYSMSETNDIAEALSAVESAPEPPAALFEHSPEPPSSNGAAPTPTEPSLAPVSPELLKTIETQATKLKSLEKTLDNLVFQTQQLELRVDKYAARERPTPSFWTWLMVSTVIAAVVGTLTSSLLLRPMNGSSDSSSQPIPSNTSDLSLPVTPR